METLKPRQHKDTLAKYTKNIELNIPLSHLGHFLASTAKLKQLWECSDFGEKETDNKWLNTGQTSTIVSSGGIRKE